MTVVPIAVAPGVNCLQPWAVISGALVGLAVSLQINSNTVKLGRQAGVAAQLQALLDELGIGELALVTHDRGTPPGDHPVSAAGDRVLGYARGQQHLWHLHPSLHPQELLFTSADAPSILADPRRFVGTAYSWLTTIPVATSDLLRTVEEFSHPGIATACPGIFTRRHSGRNGLTGVPA